MNELKNRAFTLSEVLITLGIIGVVTAMTIPTLIQNHNKKVLALKLKTTYSILNNALKMSISENGDFDNWGLNLESDSFEYVEKYWKPYLKTIKTCRTPNECNYKNYSNNNCSNSSSCAIWACRNSSNELTCLRSWTPERTTALVLANGTYIIFFVQSDSTENLMATKGVYVDTNGSDGPNVYGKDFFAFNITTKGVLPNAYSKTSAELNSNCSKNNLKNYCAAKIMKDGWEIKDDYPW